MSNKLGIFLAGGVVGAVAALLCAPRTGQEARTMVAEKVNEAWGQAQSIGSDAGVNAQQVYQSATARGQEVVSSVQAKGQEVAGQAAARVREVASNLKPSFTQDNDELRDKIEAARQRIASQVAKNAEETGQVTEEVVEAAAEGRIASCSNHDTEAACPALGRFRRAASCCIRGFPWQANSSPPMS